MPLWNLIVETAQRLAAFFDRRRGLVVTLAAVVLLVAGSTAAVVRPPILAPVLDGIAGVGMTVLSQPLKISRWFTRNKGPSARVMELELEVQRLREAAKENQRLRAMLSYASPVGYRTVPGRVVGLDLDPLRGLAWIDIGTRKGLRGGEAVMTVDGLVGVVDRAGGRLSRVRLLRNEDTPVSVRDTRTRVLGIVEWSPGDGRLRMKHVPLQADVAVGDTLISSGLGGVFPGGLAVGTVTAVEEPPERLLKAISVRPFGTFFRLEEVFVLVKRGEAGEEPGPAAGPVEGGAP